MQEIKRANILGVEFNNIDKETLLMNLIDQLISQKIVTTDNLVSEPVFYDRLSYTADELKDYYWFSEYGLYVEMDCDIAKFIDDLIKFTDIQDWQIQYDLQ